MINQYLIPVSSNKGRSASGQRKSFCQRVALHPFARLDQLFSSEFFTYAMVQCETLHYFELFFIQLGQHGHVMAVARKQLPSQPSYFFQFLDSNEKFWIFTNIHATHPRPLEKWIVLCHNCQSFYEIGKSLPILDFSNILTSSAFEYRYSFPRDFLEPNFVSNGCKISVPGIDVCGLWEQEKLLQ